MKKSYVVVMLMFHLSNLVAGEITFSMEEKCINGLHQVNNSNYSVYMACEGALGNYIGLIYTGQWSFSGTKDWPIGDRFWYQSTWGDDVTSYHYHDESDSLFVATSGIYGSAGIYQLDIKKRSYEKVFLEPELSEDIEGRFELLGVSSNNLLARFICFQNKCAKAITIKLQQN